MKRPKVILFDLGGVLVEFVGLAEVGKLLDHDPGPEAIRRRWMSSQALIRFERGACSPDEFSRSFVAEWGLAVDPASFLGMFRSWIKPPFPGVESFLAALRPRFVLACLSNTSECHWKDMLDLHGLRHALDRHYASHLIGALKPDPEIFAHVSEDMGYDPSEIVFFDDTMEHVQGARRAGFAAHRVQGLDQLRARARELGLLNSEAPDAGPKPRD